VVNKSIMSQMQMKLRKAGQEQGRGVVNRSRAMMSKRMRSS
jgi:hypothetical protein